MVLLSAQGMDLAAIAKVTLTTDNRVRGAPGDQEDRQVWVGRARPAVFDLEPVEAGGVPGG
jgi:hypothetical protein